MGTTQKFMEFTHGLQGKDLAHVEAVMEAVMNQYRTDGLAPEQLKDLKQRLADPNPQYATQEEINSVFGKPLPG